MFCPMRELARFLLLVFLLAGAFFAYKAKAVPLDPLTTFCAANPTECRKGSVSLLTARGEGTDEYYVVEIDPTTGRLPVEIAAGLTVSYSGTTGDPVPAEAAYVGGIDNTGDMQGLAVDTSGNLQVDILTMPYDQNFGAPGASTLRVAAELGVGGVAVANGNPVPVSDAGSSLTVDGTVTASNFPTTVNTDYGAAGVSTVRTASMIGVGSAAVGTTNPVPVILSDGSNNIATFHSVGNNQGTVNNPGRIMDVFSLSAGWDGSTHREMSVNTDGDLNIADGGNSITVDGTVAVSGTTNPTGRSYADSVRNAYASTNVTTAAWVQVIASTAATINELLIDDTCGEVLELGTGAAAAETRKLLIPRGGMTQAINLAIPAGTRISLKAVSGNCTTGDFVLTGLN